jgi:hypothetical protein
MLLAGHTSRLGSHSCSQKATDILLMFVPLPVNFPCLHLPLRYRYTSSLAGWLVPM